MKSVFIIAEAGVNHNGSLKTALELVDAAALAGADAVKFQTFKAESLVSKASPKAAYQLETTSRDESQHDMIRRLELGEGDHREIMDRCRLKGITFLSSPFDLESIDLLDSLGMAVFKVPSGEITNLPYLRRIGRLSREVILSTGMSDLGEIEDALDVLGESGTPRDRVTVLHCNTEYPTPMEDVNLKAMRTIAKALGVKVGYSDHTRGIEVPIAAVALRAAVIEKHMTLDKNMEGPDHRASLEPHEFKAMVEAIRNVEKAMGTGLKAPSPSERKNVPIVRKSIVAKRAIAQGEAFSGENMTVKRPGTGLSPMEWDRVIGRKAARAFAKDEFIEL